MTRVIESLDAIAADYDAAFVDLWGCVHDGLRAWPAAVAALERYRAGGGHVVLVSNAPRPRAEVELQIARLGVPEGAWDAIATSGDAARLALYHGAVGRRVHFIGEERDHSFFHPLAIDSDPMEIEIVPLTEAEGLVVTGPADPHADPAAHEGELLYAKTKGWKLLCANPDIVVDRGESREWCAGAIARLYDEMGGESLYFGKPHPPIYDLARRRLHDATGAEPERILCIGDGPDTDIAGALGEGLDALFVTGGLARDETATGPAPGGQPDPAQVERLLADRQLSAPYAIGYLR
ncbi:TIGR01459 family HAD-type hydrolase [Rhodovulum sp. 12E13]|uniref:TIGR01459 family HAD-type hydrolase n=1 Tax=Rhodovulum sp. 12E13 TaxID=2203891 RepID=UPI000E1423FD|nr:TIGR01459 family HAD-type hydrolase [Rhodovulum sp. 12E13]RDC72200.1 TIGR01459 family HAD-type hydrolase [Rhodovulum sp. 12E13]